MNLDLLPDQFEAFVSRARTALDQEIARAKAVVATATAEKGRTQSALTDNQRPVRLYPDNDRTEGVEMGEVVRGWRASNFRCE
jgi:hypothetical protein